MMDLKMLINLKDFFGDSKKDDFAARWEEFNREWDKLRIIGQYNSFSFAKLLWIFPLSEKQWKIYDKLGKNGKFGFLSKHLLRCAREEKVPSIFIHEYLRSKSSWEFAKKYYKTTKEKEDKALQTFRDGDVTDSFIVVKEMEKYKFSRNDIYKVTGNLIEATIELNQRKAKL